MVDFCKLISTREEDSVNQQLDKVNQLHWDKVNINYTAKESTMICIKTTRKAKFNLTILHVYMSFPITF